MSINRIALLVLVTCLCGEAMADDVQRLVKTKGCGTCHDETKVRIGPSFSAMTQRRKSDAATTLSIYKAKLVRAEGHPATGMTEGEVEQFTRWILDR